MGIYFACNSPSCLNRRQPAVRLKMLPLLVSLLVLLLPTSQPLPAEGWETYAFNPRLLAEDLPSLLPKNEERATECKLMLCIRDSSPGNSTYPWLINNPNARFAYVRTDSEGKASYTYTRSYNGQTLNYYLHYYDEGLFYNGFWVVNDLETGYIETEGRVFIYNSENDDCPQETANYWYIWEGGDWQYNTKIYLETC